jgi:hypothetical protein
MPTVSLKGNKMTSREFVVAAQLIDKQRVSPNHSQYLQVCKTVNDQYELIKLQQTRSLGWLLTNTKEIV